MNPARAKSLFDGPFKNLGHSLKVANLSVKLTYSGYFQEQEIPSFGGGIFFTGRVTCFVFTFSSFCLLCESDQFHEKLALESISHDADGKQSKEHASTPGKIRTTISFNQVQSRVCRRHFASSRINECNEKTLEINFTNSHSFSQLIITQIVCFAPMITNQI